MSDLPTSKLPTQQIERLDAALDAEAPSLGAEAAPGPGAPQQIVGRYRLLDRLGAGGMGAVYRAEQRAPIQRIVALKLIRPGLDDTPEIVRRFASERQALAWMDHPNIAKVLDAGADTVSGRPYFVMEYVPGLPITRYCDEHRLSNRRRLELFLQVCDAVAHAHQKMVVHRDLKPSNVLVRSENGPSTAQVKVIDFGVAKALAPSSGERAATVSLFTEVGQIVGTLDYMSPEQARGAGAGAGAEDVDARSDVYSLGVMLYELLTGALPFDPQKLRSAGLSGIERMICDTDPPRPSTRLSSLDDATSDQIARLRQTQPHELARELQRELEWIPLKAIRKERAERYATVTELADDVRNYLAGRPLRAAPESRLYRARKFLRRNRVAVAVAATFVMLLLGGIAGTSWQAARAERQRRLAQARFDDIRELASDLIFDIHADVAKLAGSQPAVDKLLAVAIEYLEKLGADSSGDVDVVSDAAVGYLRLGNLQGDQFSNNKGDPDAARASYRKAHELAQRALGIRPDDVKARRALAGAELKFGDVALMNGDEPSARKHYREAQRLMEPLADELPRDFRARADEAIAAQRIAACESGVPTDEVLRQHERSIALARRLLADFPAEEDARMFLATALARAYASKLQGGDFDGALAAAREAARLREELAANHPDDVERHVTVAITLQNLARALSRHGDDAEALAVQQRSRDVATRIHERDPANARVQVIFANAQLHFAELAGQAGRHDEALSAYDAAIRTYRAVLERAGSHRVAFQMLLYALSSLGDLLGERGEHAAAVARHREAIALVEPAAAEHPNDMALVGGLAYVNGRVGKILSDAGDARGALEPLTRAVELNARLAAADPANAMIGWNLVESRVRLGDVHAALGSTTDAARQYGQARDLAAALRHKNLRGANEIAPEALDAKLAPLSFPSTAPTTAPATSSL